jgi:hypothetical protein
MRKPAATVNMNNSAADVCIEHVVKCKAASGQVKQPHVAANNIRCA